MVGGKCRTTTLVRSNDPFMCEIPNPETPIKINENRARLRRFDAPDDRMIRRTARNHISPGIDRGVFGARGFQFDPRRTCMRKLEREIHGNVEREREKRKRGLCVSLIRWCGVKPQERAETSPFLSLLSLSSFSVSIHTVPSYTSLFCFFHVIYFIKFHVEDQFI